MLRHDQRNEIFKGFYSCSTLAILLPRISSTLRIGLTRGISYNNIISYDWYTDNRSRKKPVRRIYSGGVRFHKEQQVSLPTPPAPPVIFHVFLPFHSAISTLANTTSNTTTVMTNSSIHSVHSPISTLTYTTAITTPISPWFIYRFSKSVYSPLRRSC